jgi:hypothetical protein
LLNPAAKVASERIRIFAEGISPALLRNPASSFKAFVSPNSSTRRLCCLLHREYPADKHGIAVPARGFIHAC